MYIVHLQDLTQTLKHANYWTNTSHSTKEQCIYKCNKMYDDGCDYLMVLILLLIGIANKKR